MRKLCFSKFEILLAFTGGNRIALLQNRAFPLVNASCRTCHLAQVDSLWAPSLKTASRFSTDSGTNLYYDP